MKGRFCVWLSNGPVLEWWSENQTEKGLFMVQNVWYLNGLQSHVTLLFEYPTPMLSGIQVFGIQMVTVLGSEYL